STLVNLLSGASPPDEGEIILAGASVRFSSPADAIKHGVGTVHQELTIIPHLTVGENIMLGRWGRRGLVDEGAVDRESRQALRRLNSKLEPSQPASQLSIANWQTIEIARALTKNVSVLILDEPTSALPPLDADVLIATLRSLAAEGVTV